MLGAEQDIDFAFSPDRIHRTAVIHRLASIDDDVWIGAHAVVWQFASVIRRAQIGAGSKIASNAIVDGAHVGHDCIIGPGAFVVPGVHVADDVFIGPHVCFCNDNWPRTNKDGWFDIDDLVNGSVVVTRIHKGASIGANATIMPGVNIFDGAMVAAGACVTKDVPANHLWKRDGSVEWIRLPKRQRVCSRDIADNLVEWPSTLTVG